MSRFQTIKGLFGQLIHYKDGVRVGESWKGWFNGSYDHYSDKEGYVGYSDPGLFADQVHYNKNGEYEGESWNDSFGVTRHYDASGFVGESHQDGFGISHTYMQEDHDADMFDEPYDPDW